MELAGRVFIQAKPNAVTWRELELREQDRKYLKYNFPIISYRTSKWQIIKKGNKGLTNIGPKICDTNLIINYHVVAVGTSNKVPFVYEEICHKYYLWNVLSLTYLKPLQNNV